MVKVMGMQYQPIDSIYQEAIANDFLKNRRIWLNEEVDEVSITKVIYALNKIKKIDELKKIKMSEREPIIIICNSPGGICYQGFFLCSIMKSMIREGYEIITLTGGMSASMSFLIGLCGSKRQCLEYSSFLCHQPSGGMIGEAIKFKRESDELERLWKLSKKIIKERSKMSDELLDTIYKESWDYVIDSNLALELGIVEEII